jgi:hypothetical protein
MKNLLLLVSLLFCVQAFATKARLQALANSPQLLDEQAVFNNINFINSLGNFTSFETGANPVSATTSAGLTNAEGLFGYKSNSDDTIVVALGHQDEAVIGSRILAGQLGSSFLAQQNPVYVLWGHKGELNSYGVGFFYSNYRDRVSGATESSSGLNLGLTMGAWRFYGVATLVNSAENTLNEKFDGAGYLALNVDYSGDTNLFYLRLVRSVEKTSTLGTENSSNYIQTVRLGLTDSTLQDDSTFFWGSEVVSTVADCRTRASVACNKKYTSTFLPVWLGVEAQAISWLAIRGSVKQTVMLNQSKDEVGFPTGAFAATNGGLSEYASGPGTTVVAMGVGIGLRNLTIDGLLAASTSQNLNSANFLTQLGLKYSY